MNELKIMIFNSKKSSHYRIIVDFGYVILCYEFHFSTYFSPKNPILIAYGCNGRGLISLNNKTPLESALLGLIKPINGTH